MKIVRDRNPAVVVGDIQAPNEKATTSVFKTLTLHSRRRDDSRRRIFRGTEKRLSLFCFSAYCPDWRREIRQKPGSNSKISGRILNNYRGPFLAQSQRGFTITAEHPGPIGRMGRETNIRVVPRRKKRKNGCGHTLWTKSPHTVRIGGERTK